MKALVQRVSEALLTVDGQQISHIGYGLVCYLGVGAGDTVKELEWLARKVAGLRIFNDENGKMNLSLNDVDGEILVVSQFTLFGDIKNGYRPGFSAAEKPEIAREFYEIFCDKLAEHQIKKVARGIFAADMHIAQTNIGPVTIMLDTKA